MYALTVDVFGSVGHRFRHDQTGLDHRSVIELRSLRLNFKLSDQI